MEIHKKILIGSLLVLMVCLLGGCRNEKDTEIFLNVTKGNIVTFKWVNVNECGKSFSEKQADYLLKIKIVKE
ncbi:hypothetical protein [Faecalimonas sp.]